MEEKVEVDVLRSWISSVSKTIFPLLAWEWVDHAFSSQDAHLVHRPSVFQIFMVWTWRMPGKLSPAPV